MKKLLLLSLLLLSALVFQSCNKISHNTNEEDLVPIVFSQAAVTKTPVGLGPTEEIRALVLGTLGLLDISGVLTGPNDWSSLYFSEETIGTGDVTPTGVKHYANGEVLFEGSTATSTTYDKVAYPIDDTYVYIKALAPIEAITTAIKNDSGVPNNTVTFTINGLQDAVATKKIIQTTAAVPAVLEEPAVPAVPAVLHENSHGCGNRVNSQVNLIFDHLLSKINFYIVAENEVAVTDYWGTFVSITYKQGNSIFKYNLGTHAISDESTLIDFLAPDIRPVTEGAVVSPTEKGVIPFPEPHITTTEGILAAKQLACSLMVYPTVLDNFLNAVPPPAIPEWKIEIRTQKTDSEVIVTKFTSKTSPLIRGKQCNLNIIFKENRQIGFNVETTDWVIDGGAAIDPVPM